MIDDQNEQHHADPTRALFGFPAFAGPTASGNLRVFDAEVAQSGFCP